MAYRIIASNVMVLPQDEQYIVHYDKVENLLYDYWEPFEAGETPYFKGPSSNVYWKCEVVEE